MIRVTPCRLTILQCSQRALIDGLTFISALALARRFERRLCRRNSSRGRSRRGPSRPPPTKSTVWLSFLRSLSYL